MVKTVLYGIGTALPPCYGSQEEALAFMERVMEAALAPAELPAVLSFLRRLYRRSGIERRHTILADYTKSDPAEFTFFPRNWALRPFPSTQARMKVYEEAAVPLMADAARRALNEAGFTPADVTHVVIGACTGFFAPGPDVLLVRSLGLKPGVPRLLVGFMGCYAGFTALRAADQIVRAEAGRAVVLQVNVELCTLHFQIGRDPQIHVANCLFADGCSAAVLAGGDMCGAGRRGLAAVRAMRSHVAADTLDQMSWRIGDTGFVMHLDTNVPTSLHGEASAFVEALLRQAQLSRRDVAGWAIHPGGKKIIAALGDALGLDGGDLDSSWAILRECGNMSSATTLFVLDRELRRSDRPPGPVVALGFGPGLTVEGAVLERIQV
ncbi:MAG: type III polyketide synthase [Candidatus Sumerlaeia bacterium]